MSLFGHTYQCLSVSLVMEAVICHLFRYLFRCTLPVDGTIGTVLTLLSSSAFCKLCDIAYFTRKTCNLLIDRYSKYVALRCACLTLLIVVIFVPQGQTSSCFFLFFFANHTPLQRTHYEEQKHRTQKSYFVEGKMCITWT